MSSAEPSYHLKSIQYILSFHDMEWNRYCDKSDGVSSYEKMLALFIMNVRVMGSHNSCKDKNFIKKRKNTSDRKIISFISDSLSMIYLTIVSALAVYVISGWKALNAIKREKCIVNYHAILKYIANNIYV